MTLTELEAIVQERAAASPEESWTAKLLAKGAQAIAQKVGEEAVETALAAVADDGTLADEAADLLYHLVVLLHAKGVAVADVMSVLDARTGRSGLAEKEARGGDG